MVKERLYGDDRAAKKQAMSVLLHVIRAVVRLLHPIMPFITEEIWAALPGTEGKIIHAAYPTADDTYRFPEEEAAIDRVLRAITAIRNERQSRNIAPSKKGKVLFYAADAKTRAMLEEMKSRIMTLASANEVKILDTDPQLEDAATVVQEQMKIYVPLAGLIDYDEEIAKLTKEKERVAGEIARLQKKLSNQGFVDKAPAAVVEKEREKLAGYEGMLPELKQALSDTLAMADKNH